MSRYLFLCINLPMSRICRVNPIHIFSFDLFCPCSNCPWLIRLCRMSSVARTTSGASTMVSDQELMLSSRTVTVWYGSVCQCWGLGFGYFITALSSGLKLNTYHERKVHTAHEQSNTINFMIPILVTSMPLVYVPSRVRLFVC